jgi:hypothetical protein
MKSSAAQCVHNLPVSNLTSARTSPKDPQMAFQAEVVVLGDISRPLHSL